MERGRTGSRRVMLEGVVGIRETRRGKRQGVNARGAGRMTGIQSTTTKTKAKGSDVTTVRAETAARCHEIQVCLNKLEVPEFESVIEVGGAVRLALHIRGLPIIPYEQLRLVAVHFLGISAAAVHGIAELLADVGFVKLQTEGRTIKAALPSVPYYESLYDTLGEYAGTERTFNEAEQLSLEVVRRLARAPQNRDTLRNELNVEKKLFARAMKIGEQGSFLYFRRARGRDIVLSPTYFSENADVFADLAAASGPGTIQRAMDSVRSLQGVPLSLIEAGSVQFDGRQLPPEEVSVLKRLAQDGAIKPPSIRTSHAGEQHFLFTPTPSGAALTPTKRDLYERAMAIVAAVRQGQFLAKHFVIRSPGAVLYTLLRDGKLGRATTEANEQYRNLVRHRVARLVNAGGNFAELHLIQTEENREALAIALSLVDQGSAAGIEVDDDARRALQQDQEYVESIVASAELRRREVVPLDEDTQLELDMLLSGGRA